MTNIEIVEKFNLLTTELNKIYYAMAVRGLNAPRRLENIYVSPRHKMSKDCNLLCEDLYGSLGGLE